MIPENGFKKQIPIKEQPQWLLDLREGKLGEEIHNSMYQTRSRLEIYKVGEQYVVVDHYAPLRITEAFVVEVCDETRKDEHVGFDLRAEHEYERAEDMRRDAYEEMYADRDFDDYDDGW